METMSASPRSYDSVGDNHMLRGFFNGLTLADYANPSRLSRLSLAFQNDPNITISSQPSNGPA